MKKLTDLEFAYIAKQAAEILKSIEAKLDATEQALDTYVGTQKAA